MSFTVLIFVLFLRSIRSTRSPTVTKSRYGRFSAALFTVSGISIPDIPPTKSFTGIDEKNISPANSFSPFSVSATTLKTLLPEAFILFTETFFNILPPLSVNSPAAASHSSPGPSFGYLNSSISDVSSLLPLCKTDDKTSFIESPFTRCEPQSAEMSLGCLPQSFSV